MSDVVEKLRLRDEYEVMLGPFNQLYGLAKSLEHEAADEIERLRAERDGLREALRDLVAGVEQTGAEKWIPHRVERARAALKETGHE